MFDRRLFASVSLTLLVLASAPAWAATPPPPTELGYGALLVKLALVLAGVCLLAWVTLRWGLRKFVSAGDQGHGMQVIARAALEPRRSLLVVRVGTRHLLLASSESRVEMLTELNAEDAAMAAAAGRAPTPFERTLHRLSVSRETSPVEEAT